MPEILTYNTPPKIAKERTKQPFYISFFDWFSSQDRFTKTYIIVFLLIILSTPFIVNNYLETRQRAAGAISGESGDLWTDVIIGKRDFTDATSRGYVNPKWLELPGGVVVDRNTSGSTLGYLYAQSTRENRIIALNLDNCVPQNTTCTGEKVFGQPNLSDYGSCNGDSSFQNYPTRALANSSTLCFIKDDVLSTGENLSYIGMFTQGGNLYVPDSQNHRILIYHNAWGDQVADEVIGQDDFTANLCNRQDAWILNTTPSSSSLCLVDYSDTARFGSGVTLDNGGSLWVADNGNHRVLRFSKQTDGTISKTANIVLGQQNFTTGPGKFGTGLNQLRNPNSLRFDPNGNLYVSDGGNARILKFTPDQQKIGGTAVVFASFGGRESFVSEVDPANGLWIVNNSSTGDRLALYGFDGTLKKDLFASQSLTASFGLVKNGDLVLNSPSQGVLLMQSPLSRTGDAIAGDRPLFDSKSIFNNSRLKGCQGVAVAGNNLFATDFCRILVWNDPASLTNGKAADAVLGQLDFTANDCNRNFVANLKADNSGRVWAKVHNVEPTDNKGVINVYDANSIAPTGTQPIKIISDPVSVLGGGTMSVLKDHEGLFGLAPQTVNGRLFVWVADRNSNRVVRIRDPLTSPVIDVVLGQTNITANTCNRGQTFSKPNEPPLNLLCYPGHVSIDNFGNIYISDHSLEVEGNFRLLVFHASDFPDNNTSVIFDKTAFKSFPRYGIPNPDVGQTHATWEVAFDSQNHMVAGYNGYIGGRFLGYYLNPLDPNKNQPDGYFKDYYSMPFGATFDSQDNLYVTDINRPRVMIYKNPFNNIVPSPSSSLPSSTPTPTSSITITPTPTPVPVTQPVLNTGNITGTVSSSTGGIISGAKIAVSVNGKNFTYTTNSLGVYTITSLKPGTYLLKFSAKGGYVNQTSSVTVISSTTTTANVVLVKR